MNAATVLAALRILAEEGPALEALYETVKGLFSQSDQAKLKAAYEASVLASNQAYTDTDKVLGG